MTDEEINTDYEKETGAVIIQTFNERGIEPLETSAVIVANHGPFAWGVSLKKALENAMVMEYSAEMAYITRKLDPDANMPKTLLNKHFLRKHGKDAYYGQDK
jgi:L-ribulose-5-phosphate 4-epimerase